jgi:hypothetical protein
MAPSRRLPTAFEFRLTHFFTISLKSGRGTADSLPRRAAHVTLGRHPTRRRKTR